MQGRENQAKTEEIVIEAWLVLEERGVCGVYSLERLGCIGNQFQNLRRDLCFLIAMKLTCARCLAEYMKMVRVWFSTYPINLMSLLLGSSHPGQLADSRVGIYPAFLITSAIDLIRLKIERAMMI